MLGSAVKPHTLSSLMLVGAIAGLMFVPAPAQQKQSSKGIHRRSGQRVERRFEPERALSLSMSRCSARPPLQISGNAAPNVEIAGEKITLSDNSGTSLSGTVRAYSRSAYWLDANVGIIFESTNLRFTDPSWKPPTIISLVLRQDRVHPNRFVLKPAQGLNRDFPTTIISCQRAQATML